MDLGRLEIAAARCVRGLGCGATSWLEIESSARLGALEVVRNADFSPRNLALQSELGSAARALDDVARFGVAGGAAAREAGLFAAAAFAAGGNFATSSVVARRTFPKLSGRDTLCASVLAVLCPALCATWKRESKFARVLGQFPRDQTPFSAVRDAWNAVWNGEISPIFHEIRPLLESALAAIEHGATHILASGIESEWLGKIAREKPVLLPPQIEAISRGLLRGGNALLALPPGTGKTLLGELFLASRFGPCDENSLQIGVFVVPFVALGAGVASAMRPHLPPEMALRVFLGGEEPDLAADAAREIWVVTPEKLDAILRAQPRLFDQIRGVVFDEAHTLGEGVRGARVEGLLARFRAAQISGKSLETLLLSAALDGSQDLANWLGADLLFESKWAPTARRVAFWRSDGALEWHAWRSDGQSEKLGEKPLKFGAPIPMASRWNEVRKYEPVVWERAAKLARTLHEERGGTILCLCATRAGVRGLAAQLEREFAPLHALAPHQTLEIGGARGKAVALIEARFRSLLPLAKWLRCGVAAHHSAIPFEVRKLIETAIANGEIAVVAATSTLAEGVDLPFAQTILCDWLRFAENDAGKLEQTPLSVGFFRNIIGRCGRAGAFSEGETLVFDNPLGPEQHVAISARRAWGENVLCGQNEAPFRSSWREAETLRGAFESQILALEASGFAVRDNAFFAARNSSWREFEAQTRQNWQRDGLFDQGNLTPRGQVFASLLWSSATTKKLLGALETLPKTRVETAAQAARLNLYLWRALATCDEAGHEVSRFWSPRSRLVATPADLEAVSAAWLRGEPLETIFAGLPRAQNLGGLAQWLAFDETNDEFSMPEWSATWDKFLDFVRAAFEIWTPAIWRASAALAPLAGENARGVAWQKFASRFECGADSEFAVSLARRGAPGGRFAAAIWGRNWPFDTELSRGLAQAAREENAEIREELVVKSLREAGGKYGSQGRAVLELRDWIWARAGVSK